MWYFDSPHVVFGEEALSHLAQLTGRQAFIVTDRNIVQLGLAQLVIDPLTAAGLAHAIFAEVEPEPSLQMVQRCAAALDSAPTRLDHRPRRWIVHGCGQSRLAAV